MSSSTFMLNGTPVHFDKNAGIQGQWDNKLVAVKVLNDVVVELEPRIEFWKSLVHPHISTIFGASDDGHVAVVVSPFYSAGNIKQYLTLYPNIDRPKLIYEMALGMQYLHSQGILHGSLKPSNLLISDDGNVLVADYGIVELQPSKTKDAHRYWSPEAWKGNLSKPSDVFAFAMTAYEILTSIQPWGVLSEKHIHQLVAYEDTRPDRPEQHVELRVGLTDGMWGLINECWDKEPRLRPTFDIVVRLWAAQMLSPVNMGFTGLSRSQSVPSPITSYGHRATQSLDDISSIHSYSSGPPAYEAEFPHLMPQHPSPIITPPPPPSSTYTSLLPPSVAPFITTSYQSQPLLPGMEPIRPLQIPVRRNNGSASPRRSQSASASNTRLQQFGRMPDVHEEVSPTSTESISSLYNANALPTISNSTSGWKEQTLSSLSLDRSRPSSRNELHRPPSRNEVHHSTSRQDLRSAASRQDLRNEMHRPPSRNEIERPSSRASNRSAARTVPSRDPSEKSEKRSESPFKPYRVVNNNVSGSAVVASSSSSIMSKHISSAPSLKHASIASYNLRPTIQTSTLYSPIASRFPPEDLEPPESRPSLSRGGPRPPPLLEEYSPDEVPRRQSPDSYIPTDALPPGALPPHRLHDNSHYLSQSNVGPSAPNTPGWDAQSVISKRVGGAASLAASTNAVALVGALQTAISSTGALSSPLEFGSRVESEHEDQEEAGEAEIDFALLKIHSLALQSEKDAQRLVTAGLVPVLLGLLMSRFRASKEAKKKGLDAIGSTGKGLEMVLITLGIIAYDSISANIVYRTGSIVNLIDVFSAFSSSSAIEEEVAQREQIATLALWCLCRICRSAEIANGMIKADLVGVICTKTLRTGFAHSNLIGRYGAWLLGNLIYTDAIAESLDIKYGIVNEAVEYLRRVVGRSSPGAASNGIPAPAPPAPEDVSAALYPLSRLSRTMKMSKALTIGVKSTKSGASTDMGVILLLSSILSTSTDAALLGWACRAAGCLIRPTSADVARAMLDGGIGAGLSRVPRVLHTDEALGLTGNGAPPPLASFGFAITRFCCAEWGAGIRKRLVEEGAVDSLLAALRTASDEPCPEVHIELAMAVSFLGDVGGKDIRKEVIRAGGIDILKQVADEAKARGGKQAEAVVKACGMAVTSITGNLWTRNAASAKATMTQDWSGGCPEYQPPCPFAIDIHENDDY